MFLWRHAGELRVVMQLDHMAQVGDIARQWGTDLFLGPKHPQQAFLAARLHDEGWRALEVDPLLDPATGQPLDFRAVPRDRHVAFYGYGADYATNVDPYAGLLTSLHATGLYLGRYGVDGEKSPDRSAHPPVVQAFLAAEEERQERLFAQVPATRAEVWHDYRLLEAWDRIGIFCATGAAADSFLGPMPTLADPDGGVKIRLRRVEPFTVEAYPFPFPGSSVYLPVRVYRLAERRFETPEDFHRTVSETAPETAVFRLVAGVE